MLEKLLIIFPKLFKMLDGIIIDPLIARVYGKEIYGFFSFIIALMAILSVLMNFGMGQIIVKNIATVKGKEKLIFSNSFYLKLLVYLICLCFLFPYTINEVDNSLRFFFAGVIIAWIFETFFFLEFFNLALEKIKYNVYANCFGYIISFICKFIVVGKGFDFNYLAIAFIVEKVVISIFYLTLTKYRSFKINVVELKHWIIKCSPLALSGITIVLYLKIDQVMLKSMIGDAENAIYAASQRIISAFYFIPSVLSNTFLSQLAKSKIKLKRAQYLQQIFKLHSFLVFPYCILAILIFFFADMLILRLFGANFKESILVLKVLCFVLVLSTFGAASSKFYVLEDLLHLALSRNLFGLTINIIGNFLIIPVHGALGAAIVSVLSLFSSFLLFDLFNKKTRILFLYKIRSTYSFNHFWDVVKNGKL